MNPEGYVISAPRGSRGREVGKEGAWNDLEGLERLPSKWAGAGHLGMRPPGLVTGSRDTVFTRETHAVLHPARYLPILDPGCKQC